MHRSAFGLIIQSQRQWTSRTTRSRMLKTSGFDTDLCGPFEDYTVNYVNTTGTYTVRNADRVRILRFTLTRELSARNNSDRILCEFSISFGHESRGR